MREDGVDMGRFVNPDNSAFRVTLNSKIYVDKTELLEYTNSVLDTMDAYICNSRPRRFGKSITANMLTAYYSKGCDSEEMFALLTIGKKNDFRKHLNRYDVIHIDIQWFLSNVNKLDYIVEYITDTVLAELRECYPEIITTGVVTLPDALSRIKNATGQKFIVIIDEWDVLIRDESSNASLQQEYISFLRGLFKETGPTQYIALAYLTGILPVIRQKTQSALNHFDEFTMLEASHLAPYIGFTEEEVRALCIRYNLSFEKIRQWYDGYQLEGIDVYNPKAVVNVMLKGKFRNYWSRTASYDALVPLLKMNFDGLKSSMMQMFSGVPCRINTTTFRNDTVNFQNRDDVLTYMIHLGYLSYHKSDHTAAIPNEEIRQELRNAVESVGWDDVSKMERKS